MIGFNSNRTGMVIETEAKRPKKKKMGEAMAQGNWYILALHHDMRRLQLSKHSNLKTPKNICKFELIIQMIRALRGNEQTQVPYSNRAHNNFQHATEPIGLYKRTFMILPNWSKGTRLQFSSKTRHQAWLSREQCRPEEVANSSSPRRHVRSTLTEKT